MAVFYKKIFFIYGLFAITSVMSAQEYNISGMVLGNEDKPLEFTSIILISSDLVFTVSGLTNEKGIFLLKVPKGKYNLISEEFGKEVLLKDIDISSDQNLGVLKIEEAIGLKEVVVTEKEKLIERKVDRLIFHVENSTIAQGGDVLDALNVTPGIIVQNGQISMIGRDNMGVMINGRMINLTGDDLINYLKNLRTETIKNIEVITNPPSKYDAQGNSGLINIITKTVKNDSLSGSVNSSLSQASESIGSGGINLNYQKNRLTITSGLNYSNGSYKPYQRYTLNYPEYFWSEENFKRSHFNNLSGRATLQYRINDKLKIGGEYSLSNNLPLVKTENRSSIYNNQNVLDSTIVNLSRINMDRFTSAVNTYAIIDIDSLGRKINLDIDYLKFKSGTENAFKSESFFNTGEAKPDSYFSAFNQGDLDIDIITSRVDVEYPIQWMDLNFGTKLTFIDNNSDVSFFDTSTGNSIYDPLKSNEFLYRENTQALYISGTKQLTKELTVKIGLRGENTQTEGNSTTLNQINNNNYFKLFPTFHLNYSIESYKSLSLSYNKRINRPSYSLLNPFRFYSTSFNYAEGNPFLQPYYTNNMELSYMYKSSYTMLYASFIKNGFDQVVLVDPESYIQRVTPVNFYNQTSLGIYQGYGFRLKEVWDNRSNVSLFYKETKSNIPQVKNVEAWSASLNTTNVIDLDKEKKFRLELIYRYNFPSVMGSYEVSGYHQLDVGVKMSFLNKKMQLSVNGVDVFKGNKRTFSQTVNGIEQHNFDYSDVRRVRVSLSYTFGKIFKSNKKIEANSEEKQRIN